MFFSWDRVSLGQSIEDSTSLSPQAAETSEHRIPGSCAESPGSPWLHSGQSMHHCSYAGFLASPQMGSDGQKKMIFSPIHLTSY